MVEFRVVNRKVPDPKNKGRMLERGFKYVLDPSTYSAHADLARRLRVAPGWEEVNLNPVDTEEALLPHQTQAVEEIRRRLTSLEIP